MSSELRQALSTFRGRRPWLYLDSKGAVTIGVGHVLNDLLQALVLPLVDPTTGEPASEADIRGAWQRLALLRAEGQFGREFLPEFYRDQGALLLSEEAIDGLLGVDVEAIAAQIAAHWPGFLAAPLPAREALVELALQHGAAFLAQDRFSPLREALFARDYAQAAARLDLGESGRLADERASFRIERLQRAAHDRAVEISIEERVEALMESLAKAAEAAKGEFQKIELQVGELAQELLGRAKLFLSDLTVQAQAMAQALEEKQRLAEAEEAANKKAAQAAAAEGEAPGSVD